jgi:hypothetical protein
MASTGHVDNLLPQTLPPVISSPTMPCKKKEKLNARNVLELENLNRKAIFPAEICCNIFIQYVEQYPPWTIWRHSEFSTVTVPQK